MTGFGVGRATHATEELQVELRSVNHKFCEVKARLPRELSSLEPQATKWVKEHTARGAVDLVVKRASRTAAGQVPTVDLGLAAEYTRAWNELARAAGSSESPHVAWLAQQPGVVRLEEQQVNVEAANLALGAALEQAHAALLAMRSVEGKTICADLQARLDLVRRVVGELELLAPRTLEEYRARFAERVAELARGVAVEPSRLAQEVALWAERTDVAEELTRLGSHLVQFQALLLSDEPVGRKMDFLVQEMHREVNTTGSKSQHPELSTRVMALKAELERIREQVQNVE
jgi:uncharacterized protein (TIGR00255 family)